MKMLGRTLMNRLSFIPIFILLLFLTSSKLPSAATGGPPLGTIERISVSSIPTQAHGISEWPAISRNGRYIIYHSDAPDLVPNDTNNSHDVFLYDRLTRTTERISLGLGGVQGNNRSMFGDLSTDGRFLTFHSEATNLVPNDTNNAWDVYFHDRLTGQFERISITSAGQQANATSIFPDISGSGRFITFYSEATNLVPNDTNNATDIFLHDRQNQTTERISVSTGGAQANGPSIFPDISADGRYIVYESAAANLVPNDTNATEDIFLYDRINKTTQRINLTTSGQQGNGRASYPIITTNNRFVTYTSYADNMHPDDPDTDGDIYLRDLVSGTTELITRGLNNQPTNGESHYPSISGDGRFLAFHSWAGNLVPGDTNNTIDIFHYDRQNQTTRRVNLTITGSQANAPSTNVTISDNGRFLTFQSNASNLTLDDTNGTADIFLYLDLTYRSYLPAVFR